MKAMKQIKKRGQEPSAEALGALISAQAEDDLPTAFKLLQFATTLTPQPLMSDAKGGLHAAVRVLLQECAAQNVNDTSMVEMQDMLREMRELGFKITKELKDHAEDEAVTSAAGQATKWPPAAWQVGMHCDVRDMCGHWCARAHHPAAGLVRNPAAQPRRCLHTSLTMTSAKRYPIWGVCGVLLCVPVV